MSQKIVETAIRSKPIRMWIDGKCFNLKRLEMQSKKGSKPISVPAEQEISKDNEETENNENTSEMSYDVDDTGKMSISFELPPFYYTKLNQNDFFDLNSIRNETNTSIIIPEIGKMVVSGDNETDLKKALDELHSIIGQIRNRSMALQFIGIPLLSEEIKTNFAKFKNLVLKDTETKGLDESIFISALKLHLTIDVFVLLNDREKIEAEEALEEYNQMILKPILEKTGPLKIHVEGLECMNKNYEKVDVLYAKAKIIDETDDVSLQKIANGLSNHFYERGLLRRYSENVTIHMTLINTKYRKEAGSPKRRWAKRRPLNATKIMEKYRDFEFGTCDFNVIHISNISTIGADGFYTNLATINF